MEDLLVRPALDVIVYPRSFARLQQVARSLVFACAADTAHLW
jgi:hypothetical protein